MSLPTTLVHLTISYELLAVVDSCAEQQYAKRSEFVRQAIVEKIRTHDTVRQPSNQVVDLLMTDKQLADLRHTLTNEHYRRVNTKFYQ